MVRPSFAHAVGLMMALACGGEEPTPPGALSITVDSLPALTTATTATVTGQVIRTPAEATVPIVVSAAAGASVVSDTASESGAFGMTVPLAPDATTQISLTASDATGSTVVPVVVSVRQDGTGPVVESVTPMHLATGVPVSASISFTTSEPVDLDALNGIALDRGGIRLGGTLTIAGDGRTVSLMPDVPLAPGAPYRLAVTGLRDPAGNTQTLAFSSCFITLSATETVSLSDPAGDGLQFGTPTGASPVDLIEVLLTSSDSLLDAVLRFATPRVHVAGQPNSLIGFLDLDIDQDSTTGVQSFKDEQLLPDNTRPSSGIGSEFLVGLIPTPFVGDSAFVGRRTTVDSVELRYAFLPIPCGDYYGFSIPMPALDSDFDFHLVGYFLTPGSGGGYDDPAPDSSHFVVGVTPATAATAARAGDAYRRVPAMPRRVFALPRWVRSAP